MPRKYFRKFLPTHQNVLDNRFVKLFGPYLAHPNLWHLHRRSVAGGVAAGMACGVIPVPFQHLCTVLSAIVFRVNLPVALFTSLYRNPFTVLPIYLTAFYLGNLVTRSAGAPPISEPPAFSLMNFFDWLRAFARWAIGLGPALAIGLVIMGSILGVLGYIAARVGWRLMVVRAWRERSARRVAGLHNG
jgi:uncharacterized protein (DUF2062 family)